jgi:conjugal transfer ATP-binding protein TraC
METLMLAIEKQLSKLAGYLGMRVPAENISNAQEELQKAINQSTNSATPLAELLPYHYYDEEAGIAHNRNGTSGFWFEINPIVGSNAQIEKNLTLFFNDELPDGGYLQFLILASHDVSNVLKCWEQERIHGGKQLLKLTEYRKKFIKDCAIDFENSNDGRLARHFRLFITYSSADNGQSKSVQKIQQFKKKLQNKLQAEKFSPRECGAADLIQVGREILQMQLNTETAPSYNILNNLSDQIVEQTTPVSVEAERIVHKTSGLVSKVFYPKEFPDSYSLSEMINLLGSGDKSIPGRFVISYSIAANVGNSGTSNILAQGYRSMHAAEMPYTRNDLNAKAESNEWRQIIAIHKNGERFLSESMSVMITAPEDSIDIAEETLKSIWNGQDWKLSVNRNLQLLGMLSLLPMSGAGYWRSLSYFRQARYALSGEVVAKLPLQGEWKGVPKSGALMMGRRGQLFNFNPYYRIGGGGNYNICLMAPSGAGKSFFLQELATSSLSQDVAVFVLDIGASYQNLAHLLDGEIIRFNQDNNISLNPFASLSSSGAVYVAAGQMFKAGLSDVEVSLKTGLSLEKIAALKIGHSGVGSDTKISDGIEILEITGVDEEGKAKIFFVTKDSILYAKAMLATMCGASGDIRGEALVERAITEGVGQYGTNLDINKLCNILENLKDRTGGVIESARQLADSLYPYTEEGVHGRFFKAGKAASFKEMLTVFEFEEIKDDKPLLAVVLQVILMQITMQFLCGDRSRKFMLIVDEAWMILDYAASFLEGFARTVRKYGGSLVVCTQDLSSFKKGEAQSAILESSTWKLIMQQSEVGIETFAKSEQYQNMLDLIRSVRKCDRNKFSEILFDTNGAKVVGRLAVDPYSAALYSTESDDYALLQALQKQGMPKDEAILVLAKKYGHQEPSIKAEGGI